MRESLGFAMDCDETEPLPVGPDNKDMRAQPVVIYDGGDAEMQGVQWDITDDDNYAEIQNEALSDVTGDGSDVEMRSVRSHNHELQPVETVEGDEGDTFGQSWRHLGCENYGTWFYVLNYCLDGYSGPVNRQNFHAMSRLGLLVWDTRRLLALGLAQLPEGGYSDHEARHEDLGARLVVWRWVFEREYHRVCRAPFRNQVTTERFRRIFDGWVAGDMWAAVGRDVARILDEVLVLGWTYDGHVDVEEHRAVYNAVVVRMMDRVRDEKVAYEWEPPSSENEDEESENSWLSGSTEEE